MTRVLVACVGNALRTDDGVGPRIAALLADRELPEGVEVRDFGIGGVHLVQSLLDGDFAALVVVDCADRGRPPGTVMEIDPEVLDVNELPHTERYDYLADMHYTKPERALALAKGLGVLPERTLLIGIQPQDAETLGQELTPVVERAAEFTARHVVELAAAIQAEGA